MCWGGERRKCERWRIFLGSLMLGLGQGIWFAGSLACCRYLSALICHEKRYPEVRSVQAEMGLFLLSNCQLSADLKDLGARASSSHAVLNLTPTSTAAEKRGEKSN